LHPLDVTSRTALNAPWHLAMFVPLEILSRREGALLKQDSTYKSRMLGLPEIRSVDDFAFLLRIPIATIENFSKRSWTTGYKTFGIPKKPTGMRIIHAPVRELKFIQTWILNNILCHLRSSRCSTAFEVGNGIRDNASRHIEQAYVINVDIKDFFPSITAGKVFQVFHSIGYNKNVAWLLTNLLTFKGVLPQGSPASPKLANLICNRLDARIMGYCQLKNMAYSRYADDITISTSNRVHIRGTIRFLNFVVESEAFALRPEKTSVYGRSKAKMVTGLVVSEDVRIGRRRYRELRSLVCEALRTNDADKLSYVNGYMNFLKDVDVSTYKMLYAYYISLKSKFEGVAFSTATVDINLAA
jgi:RNA-directed DNA polymerase